jgi:hypothetical protein
MSILNPTSQELLPEEEARFLGIYGLYRERVSQEDNLINHRMSWMLWSQAILFAFWASTGNGSLSLLADAASKHEAAFLQLIIGVVGFFFAFGSRVSIKAAQDEIKYLADICFAKYPDLKKAMDHNVIPDLIGHKKGRLLSHIVPSGAPFLFMLMWVALVAFGIYHIYKSFKP